MRPKPRKLIEEKEFILTTYTCPYCKIKWGDEEDATKCRDVCFAQVLDDYTKERSEACKKLYDEGVYLPHNTRKEG